jgi:hypothetical protein
MVAVHVAPRPNESAPIVVVMPVFEDLTSASSLLVRLGKLYGDGVHVVAVDDGSVRQPLPVSAFVEAGIRGTLIRLRRNLGHQRAIAVGLHYVADHVASAGATVVMDSDGEDLPESIAALVGPLQQEGVDLVVAERKSRVESLRFRAFYAVYRVLFQLLTGHRIRFGNFMALRRPALLRLVAMQELWIHLAACVLVSKLRIVAQPLDRGPRIAGTSKMNFVGLALHGFRAAMVFAEDVLVRVGIGCAFVAMASIAGIVAAIALKLLGFATPGWFSVALGILFLVLFQTGALTLMTLMLSGVMRRPVAIAPYSELIESVVQADAPRARASA